MCSIASVVTNFVKKIMMTATYPIHLLLKAPGSCTHPTPNKPQKIKPRTLDVSLSIDVKLTQL